MSTEPYVVIIVVAATGCGLVGGVFFAFSTFVMRALAQLPPAHGMAAMQSINRVVINPLFLGAFLGTAAVCAGLIVLAVIRWPAMTLLAGSASYVLGTFAVTMVGNVPLNNRLELVDPAAPQAASLWDEYVHRWTFWNHVRTAAALAACVLLICASRANT